MDMGLADFPFFWGLPKMERNLSFCFEYETEDHSCPNAVHVTPNPNTVSDIELVLTANTCIQALASKHGLEQALSMVQDAAMGKLLNGSRFDALWVDENEQI